MKKSRICYYCNKEIDLVNFRFDINVNIFFKDNKIILFCNKTCRNKYELLNKDKENG